MHGSLLALLEQHTPKRQGTCFHNLDPQVPIIGVDEPNQGRKLSRRYLLLINKAVPSA